MNREEILAQIKQHEGRLKVLRSLFFQTAGRKREIKKLEAELVRLRALLKGYGRMFAGPRKGVAAPGGVPGMVLALLTIGLIVFLRGAR